MIFIRTSIENDVQLKAGGFMNVHGKDYEVDNVTGRNHEGPAANTPVRRLTATSIIGDPVENTRGESLGKIDNLMINIVSGGIDYVVLEFGAFLGLGGKLFAIPFSKLYLNPDKECFVLDRDRASFADMPGFDKTHWPATNDHSYFNDVNTYWGAAIQP